MIKEDFVSFELAKLPKEEIEGQGEPKPADKVKPKFNVNNWIVTMADNLYQVTAIIDDKYQLKYGDNYSIQKCSDVDKNARLWDITKDAKDGDVLVDDEGRVAIFERIEDTYGEGEPDKWCSYCYIEDGYFEENVLRPLTHYIQNTFPATNGQRALLFTRMKEAGCEFDFEKMELKKTNSPVLSSSSNIGKDVPAEWSEEDEKMQNNLIRLLIRLSACTHTNSTSPSYSYPCEIDWLKSLKPQNHWKPTEEQIDALWKVFAGMKTDSQEEINDVCLIGELYEQLEKLSVCGN